MGDAKTNHKEAKAGRSQYANKAPIKVAAKRSLGWRAQGRHPRGGARCASGRAAASHLPPRFRFPAAQPCKH